MIVARINGIEYDAETEFSIKEKTGNKTSSSIRVRVDEQPTPKAGDIIEIVADGTRLFYGVCGIPKSPKYTSIYQPRIYEIECENANAILSNRVVNMAAQNQTITQIVSGLYAEYIAAEGIALGEISDIPVVMQYYTASDMTLRDVLDELASQVSAIWQVTSDKRFIFLVRDEFPLFPDTITSDYLFGAELQHKTTDYTMRTVQIISGATDTTDPQTETLTYDGEQKVFTVTFPIKNKPTLYVNGTIVPSDLVGISGIDDGQDKVFTFTSGSQNISYKENSDYLKQGDAVRVDYVGTFNIRVVSQNAEKIAEIAQKTGTSGIIENVLLAKSITNTNDAMNTASALLQEFSAERGEVSFWIPSAWLYQNGHTLDDVYVYTKMRFEMPEIGIVGDFVITERTLQPFGHDLSTNTRRNLKVSLRLVDRDLLQSYGQIFSSLQKGIQQLSIRGDEVVVDAYAMQETMQASETVAFSADNAYCPVASNVPVNGSLFAPCDFGNNVYPMQAIYVGPKAPHFPVSTSAIQDGGIFTPNNFGNDVYPMEDVAL